MLKTCKTCGRIKPQEHFEYLKKKKCHRNQCKECRQEYLRQWRQNNKDKTLEYARQKHDKHKGRHQYRIARNCRTRIWDALNNTGHKKTHKTLNLVGLNVVDLINYLESKFRPGMSWQNYGKEWHIDHIRPCASFDLTDKSQLKQCFHYSNLQPLWTHDNLSKGSSWPVNELSGDASENDHRSTTPQK